MIDLKSRVNGWPPLWDVVRSSLSWTYFMSLWDGSFSIRGTQSPAKHRYPPLILCLKAMIKCGKDKRLLFGQIMTRELFNKVSLIPNIKLLQACWCDGQCQRHTLSSSGSALRWMGFMVWIETKPALSTSLLSSIPFFLTFFLCPFPPFLSLSEDRCFLFYLCPGFEAYLRAYLVLIFKPFLGGDRGKSKPIPP